MSFGEFVKTLREKNELGLREFCKKNGHDPSNWSKIERGVLLPPSKKETLEEWASQLGLKKSDAEWFEFFDLAYLEQGKLPHDILSDAEVVERLPLFFRTLRGQKPTRDEMKQLSYLLKQA